MFQQQLIQKCGTIIDFGSCSIENQVNKDHPSFNMKLISERKQSVAAVTPELRVSASSQSSHHDPWDRTVPVDEVNWDDTTVFRRQSEHPKKWWVFSFNDYLRSIDRLEMPVEQVQPGTWPISTPIE